MLNQHHLAVAIFALATFAATGSANAITPDDNIVIGIGSYDDSCARWVAARTASRDAPNKADEYLMVVWMQGYLSGANLTNTYADPKTAVALPSVAKFSIWLDKACKDEPRTPVFFLADKLMKELRKPAGR